MPDRRTVDELSIEELETILAIRKRAAREARLKRLRAEGRVLNVPESDAPAPPITPPLESIAASPSYYHVSEVPEDDKPRRRIHLFPGRRTIKTWRDRFLLLIEIGAVAGGQG